ncbi:MAG: uroporphyrinogen decarboxylase family protein [Chloroflexi bacterium]|nr:uroporphyrinogen decarboxylase family protein [Chloroflexota bacterium]
MSSFNKRKRLEAVIAGEKPDRIPVALWRHWPGDDQDAQALAAAHLQWQTQYDWDLLKSGAGQQLLRRGLGRRDGMAGSH